MSADDGGRPPHTRLDRSDKEGTGPAPDLTWPGRTEDVPLYRNQATHEVDDDNGIRRPLRSDKEAGRG